MRRQITLSGIHKMHNTMPEAFYIKNQQNYNEIKIDSIEIRLFKDFESLFGNQKNSYVSKKSYDELKASERRHKKQKYFLPVINEKKNFILTQENKLHTKLDKIIENESSFTSTSSTLTNRVKIQQTTQESKIKFQEPQLDSSLKPINGKSSIKTSNSKTSHRKSTKIKSTPIIIPIHVQKLMNLI